MMIQLSSGHLALPKSAAQFEQDHVALTQAIAQLRAILASALDPIVTIDLDGTIHTASDSIERVFGWKPKELLGRNVNVLIPSPHHEAHDGYLATYRRTGVTNILGRTREFDALRRDGTQFPIELSVSRVDVPGRAEPLFTGIIHDISERRKLEEQLQHQQWRLEELVQERTSELAQSQEQLRTADRLASIGTLAAGLGHDMNNVLLPIRARLDSLDATDLPAKAREQFQAVRRSIAYLQQLSDGLHLLALDPDDAHATGGSTNLAEWWAQVGSLLMKPLPKRIAFHGDVPADLPPVAVAPHRLTQAVLNLLVNAGEAISGEGIVRLWARPGLSAHIVQLGVTDTGEGMNDEVRRHALDQFFTTKKRGLGTGLGLSLVHGVTKSAGGTIDIETVLGQGTTVMLNLPVSQQRRDGGRDGGRDELSGGARRSAVISIRDRRAASFAAALIESAGLGVQYLWNGADLPHDSTAQLWITEPATVSPQRIRDFLRDNRQAQVILFGRPETNAEAWTIPGGRVTVIDSQFDFDLIRRVLGEAIENISRT